ncbi:porin family protein [Kordiimonas aestuarii]|uniref:porin family protein n=1 Tax=Kordiimonas aestuarii TaxID=1005925 RepID=UPI0021CE4497|nr:porin family protein [Kordiimonas aestuarii]
MKKTILTATIAATLLVAGAANAQDEKHFDGFYLGGEFGHTISDGADDIYYGAVGGYRKQLDNNFVVGVEGTFGTADITYLDHIWTVNGTVGYAFGAEKRDLIFGGVGYVKAKASAAGYSVTGDDISFIAGYERAVGDNVSLRVKANVYGDDTVVPSVGVAFRF